MQKTERVTDEMVKALRDELKTFKPDDVLRRALTAALFSAEEKAVEDREWHRSDNDYGGVMLYSLREDGWRKGEPVMVNDVTIRVERASGSSTDIEPIIQRIRSALVDVPAVESEPVAFVSRDTLTSLLNDFGGLYQLKTPKWKTEETTVPLYAHPSRSSPQSAEGEKIAKLTEALEAAAGWIGILRGSTGNIVMPLDDARNPRVVEEHTNTLISEALSTPPSPYGGDTGEDSATDQKGCAE